MYSLLFWGAGLESAKPRQPESRGFPLDRRDVGEAGAVTKLGAGNRVLGPIAVAKLELYEKERVLF